MGILNSMSAANQGMSGATLSWLLTEQRRTNALLQEQNALLVAMLGTMRDASPGPHDITTAERDGALLRARRLASSASGEVGRQGRRQKRRGVEE